MSLRVTGHGLHLLAAHRALTRQLEEIERAAVQGRAPGTGGQALTPLPPELWAQLSPSLTRLGSLSETIARRHAPEALQAAEARQPLSATLRWIALLLRRLEETLEDLDPATIARKFGAFAAPEEAEQMAAEVAAMHAELTAAQQALEAFRAAAQKPESGKAGQETKEPKK
ncbi:MAG TPA: hypothetical protein VFB38_25040 [Chthonomonadaceae bacterium]|nr:hypothetical protein [Chthonomonadaceae bacterium]